MRPLVSPLRLSLILFAISTAGGCVQGRESESTRYYRLDFPLDAAYAVALGTGLDAYELDVFGFPREAASLALLSPSEDLAAIVDPGPRVLEQFAAVRTDDSAIIAALFLTSCDDEIVEGLLRIAHTVRGERLLVYAGPATVSALLAHPEYRRRGGAAYIDLREATAGQPIQVGGILDAESVPLTTSAAEVAWRFSGNHRTLLYMPRGVSEPELRKLRSPLFDAINFALLDGSRLGDFSPKPSDAPEPTPSLPTMLHLLDEFDLGDLPVHFTSLSGDDPSRHSAVQFHGELLAVDGLRDWL